MTADLRPDLLAALRADLIGPFDVSSPAEVLPLPPSRWYLTGFLAPQDERETQDPTSDDEFGNEPDDDAEDAPAEPEAKQPNLFPASIGMSVLLPKHDGTAPDVVRATVRFAEYVREALPDEGRKKRAVWKRVVLPAFDVDVPLDAKSVDRGVALRDTRGVVVCGKLEPADAPGLPAGTRALSLFVVNRRAPGERGRIDEQFLFQVELEVEYAKGFVPRPNRQGEDALDFDDRVADLQFRDRVEWAVGHGCSVEVVGDTERATRVRTTWIPRHEVRRVVTREEATVTTSMDQLATLIDAGALKAALAPLVGVYAAWIGEQSTIDVGSSKRESTKQELLKNADRAKRRIAQGIELLAKDAEAREAFCLMNRAMADAARARSPARYTDGRQPTWRMFQLAFVVLSLPGIAHPAHEHRKEVELIFFPTGGGKTEAYLGVIAFTMLLRRIHGQHRPDRGLGVAVLLRYTLRLLTLDQLGRAATLICALELIRKERVERLGDVRFAVGLWVGRSATANTMEQVKKLVTEYKNSAAKNPSSPFPLTNCPWCSRKLGRDSLVLGPNRSSPEEVIVSCVTPPGEAPSDCPFSPRKNSEGLPVLFVDEPIYRELPAFIVATVDKFAMLPWRGETGMLFGRASARDGRQFFGPLDRAPKGSTLLPAGLLPPELIVQDELHLISGPLGTMVGLFETAVEHLSTRRDGEHAFVPKVIASTATVRRAREQIQALFGRREMSLFPPPGIDSGNTFFADVDRASPGRLYVGIAAPGRAFKATLLRTYIALLTGAQKHFDPRGPEAQVADPYMSLVGYFNSLRELGGMRRLVDDDVRTRAASIEKRRPEGHGGAHPWAKNREIGSLVELTSRLKAGEIRDAKVALERRFVKPEHVDVVLASNMISVGVDIDRLGLMVIAGQPKTTSEYIQASSRVGREHPGLVVTCYNVRRPRDRSHYERFVAYHESFYRHVEAMSLTPFSGPALERGLAATLLAMVRLGDLAMTAPASAMDIGKHRAGADACIAAVAARAGHYVSYADTEDHERATKGVEDRSRKIVDAWEKLVNMARHEGATKRSYSPFDRDKAAGKPLLFGATDDDKPPVDSDEGRFAAPTSMRDVEPSVHLWIERRSLGGRR